MSDKYKALAIVIGFALVFMALYLTRPGQGSPEAPVELPAAALPPTRVPPLAPSPPPVEAALDAAVAAPEPEPRQEIPDIFAGDAPDVITRNHIRLIDGGTISYRDTKALYDYGKANKDDARPQLLLAWDAMQRQWDAMATRLYVKAWKADPRVKELPRMQRDMLSVVMRFDKMEGREASQAIIDIYGREALPLLGEMMADARAERRGPHVLRLEALQAKLSEL